MKSYLLIGQSNMAGFGFYKDAVEVKTNNIKLMKCGLWRDFRRPISNYVPSAGGVCLGERFGELCAEYNGEPVGIIPCAMGNTSLSQWQPGENLYDHTVAICKIAQRESEIAGVLWHQGEADCGDDLYPLYKEKLMNIINSLRKDLSLDKVPFLLGGLGEYLEKRCDEPYFETKFKNYIKINEILQSLEKEDPYIGYVSSEGLTSNPDLLHFTAQSLYTFGERYFEKYKAIKER